MNSNMAINIAKSKIDEAFEIMKEQVKDTRNVALEEAAQACEKHTQFGFIFAKIVRDLKEERL